MVAARAKTGLSTNRVMVVNAPVGSDWISVSETSLVPEALTSWVTRPDCGAVVMFVGMARNNSTRGEVIEALEYETSVDLAATRIAQVIEVARSRWPALGSVAIHHRIGVVRVGEPAVVIALSSPHRRAAFEASQFCIDTVKKCVPMWKREIWQGGSAWSQEAQDLLDVSEV